MASRASISVLSWLFIFSSASAALVDMNRANDTANELSGSNSSYSHSTSLATGTVPGSTQSSQAKIILIAAIGGSVILALWLIIIGIYIWRRRQRTRRYAPDPFVMVPPPATIIETPLPKTTSLIDSISPSHHRFSFETNADRGSGIGTLCTEIFPLPSEVEHVYQQLEALSDEVESIRRRQSSFHPKELDALEPSQATRTVQDDIENLRAEINRMKRGRTSIDTHAMSMGPLRPLELLRDLALLRAEIEELLLQSHSPGMEPLERLPSYSSRKTTHSRVDGQPPPPVPPLPAVYTR